MPVASVLTSLVLSPDSDDSVGDVIGLGLFRPEVGTRCWIIVLLMAYLN